MSGGAILAAAAAAIAALVFLANLRTFVVRRRNRRASLRALARQWDRWERL